VPVEGTVSSRPTFAWRTYRTPPHSRYRAGVITDLNVEWVGDELRVRWRDGEDPTVFVSGSPDDAGTVIVAVETPGRLRIAGLPIGFRAYVHVLDLDGSWVVAGERLIRLSRTGKVVDLGGHRRGDGRVVRWGRLFAGDPIDDLDPAGRDAMRGLGIRTVCDLRDGDESAGRPAWLDPGVGWELPGLGEGEAGQIAEVVALAADPDNHALLFHAGIGQDRAVVVAALLLSAVGVADADLPFFPTRPEVLADLRDRYGSVEGYLAGAGRLVGGELAALEEALLAP